MRHLYIIIYLLVLMIPLSIPTLTAQAQPKEDKSLHVRIEKVEDNISELRREQLNYKIEKDLLKEMLASKKQMTEPHWTQVLAALLVPTIAVFGSFIAYRQWRTTQRKLILDLFDRRFAVYGAARSLIASILTSGRAKEEELSKFLSGTREAKWLLNDDIATYFDKQMWHNAIELQALDDTVKSLPVGDERSANVIRQGEIKKWMREQYKVLDEKFTPFLKLGH